MKSGTKLLQRYGLSTQSSIAEIATVLGSPHLRVNSEDEVLHAILAVAKERTTETGPLWSTLRLSWLSSEALALVPAGAPGAADARAAHAARLECGYRFGLWPTLLCGAEGVALPRQSYAFTASVPPGSSAGIFFVWIEPKNPLGNNVRTEATIALRLLCGKPFPVCEL
jgi:hypothetical protein